MAIQIHSIFPEIDQVTSLQEFNFRMRLTPFSSASGGLKTISVQNDFVCVAKRNRIRLRSKYASQNWNEMVLHQLQGPKDPQGKPWFFSGIRLHHMPSYCVGPDGVRIEPDILSMTKYRPAGAHTNIAFPYILLCASSLSSSSSAFIVLGSALTSPLYSLASRKSPIHHASEKCNPPSSDRHLIRLRCPPFFLRLRISSAFDGQASHPP